jgi:hypothetical protein
MIIHTVRTSVFQKISDFLAESSIVIVWVSIFICYIGSIYPTSIFASAVGSVGIIFPILSFILIPRKNKYITIQALAIGFAFIPAFFYWCSVL